MKQSYLQLDHNIEDFGVKFHMKSELSPKLWWGVTGTSRSSSQNRVGYFGRGKVGGIIWASLDSVSAMTPN